MENNLNRPAVRRIALVMILAIAPGFAGAYTGFYCRKFIAGPRRN